MRNRLGTRIKRILTLSLFVFATFIGGRVANAAPSWRDPVLISAQASADFDMVWSGASAHIAYEYGGHVYYRTSNSSGAAGPAEDLGTGSRPYIVLTPAGVGIVFATTAPGPSTIRLAVKNGASWDTTDIAAGSEPVAVTDASGNIHVLYLADTSGDGYSDVMYVSNASGPFAAPVRLFESFYYNEGGSRCYRYFYDHALAVDSLGNYHVMVRNHAIDGGMGWTDHAQVLIYKTNAVKDGAGNDYSATLDQVAGSSSPYALGRHAMAGGAGAMYMYVSKSGTVTRYATSGAAPAGTVIGSGGAASCDPLDGSIAVYSGAGGVITQYSGSEQALVDSQARNITGGTCAVSVDGDDTYVVYQGGDGKLYFTSYPYTPPTDAEAVSMDKDALTFDVIKGTNTAAANITANLVLPTSGANGTTIAWESSNAGVIAANGTVTRPAWASGNASVTLTATVSKGAQSATSQFALTVLSLNQTDAEAVVADKTALTFDAIKNANSVANQITSNLTLPAVGASGSTITWSSSDEMSIASNGAVARKAWAAGDANVTLTAQIVKGAASDSKTFNLIVKALAATDAEAVSTDKASLTFATIKGANAAEDSITSDLSLPNSGANGTTVAWASSNAAVIGTDGLVSRPAWNLADTEVTLTATISKGSSSDTVAFILTVVHREQTDADAVSADKASLTFASIKGANTLAGAVTSNLVLPTAGGNGTSISWASSDDTAVRPDGTVIRRAWASGDASVTLTATIWKGAVSDTATLSLTVKSQDPTDAEAVAADKAGLTFSAIRGSNTAQDQIASNLSLPAAGANGSSIAWTSSDAVAVSAAGVVTRPSSAAGDKAVTLTATASKGASNDTVVFNLTVKALPEEHHDEQDDEDTAPQTPPLATPGRVSATEVAGSAGSHVEEVSAEEAESGIVVERAALSEMVEHGGRIEVKSPDATVILTSAVAGSISGSSTETPVTVSVTASSTPSLTPVPASVPAGRTVQVLVDLGKDAEPLRRGSISLTLPYDPSRIQSPERLGIYMLQDGQWKYAGGIVDPVSGTISMPLTESAQYAVFEDRREFPDATGHWASEAVHLLTSRWVVGGEPDGSYGPDNLATRAEFTAVAVRSLHLDGWSGSGNPATTFSDTQTGDWYLESVIEGVAAGIVQGYPDGSFRPDQPLSREEAIVLTLRLARALGVSSPSGDGSPAPTVGDLQDVSDWANSDVSAALGMGIVSGDDAGMLRPQETVTRAEMATMMLRVLRIKGII